MRKIEDMLEEGQTIEEFILECSLDFGYFVKRVLDMDYEWFHDEWFRAFHNYERSAIIAARGHGKTQMLGVNYALWYTFFHENKKFLIISKTKEQSTSILDELKKTIYNNELLQKLQPDHRSATWTKTEINTSTRCQILCKPYSNTIRGLHVDRALADEVAFYEDKNIFYYVFSPTLNVQKGHLMAISTPQSEGDLIMELYHNNQYFSKVYPAVDENEDPLWDEQFSKDRLEQIREEIGDLKFNREYKCVERGTKILTKKGYKKIEDIKVGDKVFGNGKFVEVLETFDTQASKLIDVEMSAGRKISLTENHPVLIIKQSGTKQKAYAKGYSHIPPKHGFDTEWRNAGELERGDIVCFPRDGASGEVNISDEALELAGWYVAEGFTNDYTRIDGRSWSGSIAQKDEETRNKIANLIRSVWDYEPLINEKEVRFFTEEICAYYHYFFGGSSYEKYLPDWIFELTERQFKIFFDALFAGDGSRSYHYKNGQYTYLTASETLALQLKILLRKFGILATKTDGEYYSVRWYDNSHRIWKNSDYIFERVQKVSEREGSFDTYNIRTEDNTFCTENFLVHNCDPMASGTSIFTLQQLNDATDPNIRLEENPELDIDRNIFIGIDFGLSDAYEAGWTVIVILEKEMFTTCPDCHNTVSFDHQKNGYVCANHGAVHPVEKEGKLVIRDIDRSKGLHPSVIETRIKTYRDRWAAREIWIDESTFGKNYREKLAAEELPIRGMTFTRENRNELIMSLMKTFQKGDLVIPYDQDDEKTNYLSNTLIKELNAMTTGETNQGLPTFETTAMFDDMVMALALAVYGATQQMPVLDYW